MCFKMVFFFKQKTAYEMRISDWSSDVCSSDLKLSETPDGESSLLDQAMLIYGGNMGSSNRHDHFPLPITVAGGGCGTLKGNTHARCADHTPLANVDRKSVV